jgi:hypothetical protein
MVRTNGTLSYHCYRATNNTDARIGCVPKVPDPPYRCVGQFANTKCAEEGPDDGENCCIAADFFSKETNSFSSSRQECKSLSDWCASPECEDDCLDHGQKTVLRIAHKPKQLSHLLPTLHHAREDLP